MNLSKRICRACWQLYLDANPQIPEVGLWRIPAHIVAWAEENHPNPKGLLIASPDGCTTACFDCGTIIPIGDCFYSSTVDQRALCEGCYGKARKAGRARVRDGR